VPVNLQQQGGGEHQGEAHRARDAMQQVPVLEWEDGGVTRRLSQSMAILEFLEERYPSPPLRPADLYLRGKVRQLSEIVNSGIQPFQNLSVLRLVKNELNGDEQAFARRFIERSFAAFQTAAEEVAGQFCVGDAVSLADVCLLPQLYGARRYGLDMTKLATLTRLEEACMALPAFQAAHADRQVDAIAGAG
jgi:maleylpyruvate isomerase